MTDGVNTLMPSKCEASSSNAGSSTLPRRKTGLSSSTVGSTLLSKKRSDRVEYGDAPISAGASEAPNVQRPSLSRHRKRSQSSLPCFGFAIRSYLTEFLVDVFIFWLLCFFLGKSNLRRRVLQSWRVLDCAAHARCVATKDLACGAPRVGQSQVVMRLESAGLHVRKRRRSECQLGYRRASIAMAR